MDGLSRYARAIERLFGSLLSPDDTWETALESLADALAADHAIAMTRRSGDLSVTALTAARVDSRHLAAFEDAARAGRLEPLLRLAEPYAPLRTNAMLAQKELVRTDLFNQVVRPMNGYYGVVVVTPFSSVGQSVFVACRPQAKPDFDTADLRRLSALAPHIGAAMGLQNALAAARAETRAACDALDAAEVGVIIVDGAGTPAFVSRRADRLLCEKRGLTLRGGSLGAATGSATQSLRRLIASAAGRRFGEGDLRLALPQPPGRRPLIVRAAPLTRASAEAAGDSRFRVALFLHDPSARDEPEARTIAAAYGLTPREAEVALALARGADVNAAGRALGVSVGTVRTHLKAVFAKTETRRQGDLVRLVLSLRP